MTAQDVAAVGQDLHLTGVDARVGCLGAVSGRLLAMLWVTVVGSLA
jgi:hypothetical protein